MHLKLLAIAFPVLAAIGAHTSAASPSGCYSRLEADTLTIGNTLIERKFVWNGGNLETFSITDKAFGKVHYSCNPGPDFRIKKTGHDSRKPSGRFRGSVTLSYFPSFSGT